jgi:hypothetical protein
VDQDRAFLPPGAPEQGTGIPRLQDPIAGYDVFFMMRELNIIAHAFAAPGNGEDPTRGVGVRLLGSTTAESSPSRSWKKSPHTGKKLTSTMLIV